MIHHRHSLRIQGYDYAQAGVYFVTFCVQERQCLFGEIVGDQMLLNQYGRIVRDEWLRSSEIRPGLQLDEFVVMPNHFLGILIIVDDSSGVGAHSCAPLPVPQKTALLRRTPRSLGAIVAGFKSSATKRVNEIRHMPGAAVWQRNYFEHVIRNEREMEKAREYIGNNPLKWALDRENPALAPGHNRV
jgi:REP element-mobilizing transposase RayT